MWNLYWIKLWTKRKQMSRLIHRTFENTFGAPNIQSMLFVKKREKIYYKLKIIGFSFG